MDAYDYMGERAAHDDAEWRAARDAVLANEDTTARIGREVFAEYRETIMELCSGAYGDGAYVGRQIAEAAERKIDQAALDVIYGWAEDRAMRGVA